MEETSARKGQDSLGILADLDAHRVIRATEGRSLETAARFAADLAEHGGGPAEVTDTRSEMSTAFISGIRRYPPNARMTFDRFPLAAKLSEALDAVRRHEVATPPELTHTRRLSSKNWTDPSVRPRAEPARLRRPCAQPATARAPRRREDRQAFHDQDPSYAPEHLPRRRSGARRSRPQPLKDSVALVDKHRQGILTRHKNHPTNGPLEAINSLIQAAQARARGYHTKARMTTIVHLTASRPQPPTPTHPTPAYMTSR